MILTLFNNNKGVVQYSASNQVTCVRRGVLKIGDSTVTIKAKTPTELPILCNGKTGEFEATFTDEHGKVYKLLNVYLVDGRIALPSAEFQEFVNLYKKANANNSIEGQYNQQKQEAINALNKHPLKSLIE